MGSALPRKLVRRGSGAVPPGAVGGVGVGVDDAAPVAAFACGGALLATDLRPPSLEGMGTDRDRYMSGLLAC